MANFQIKKGRNLPLKGEAQKNTVQLPIPIQAAIQPSDLRGLKPRLALQEGDLVKVGTPILTDKTLPEIKVASPVSGKIVAINRGEKRVLLSIVIEADGKQESEIFPKFTEQQIKNISKEDVVKILLDGGLWPIIRQRPFSKIANPQETPKSIFIHAMNTEPLAADVDFILRDKEKEFQVGLNVIKRLTTGNVHLCVSPNAKSEALTKSQNVQIQQFSGPHPTGNVSIHIHYIDPINKGEIVWYVEAQDVLRIAELFLNGRHSAERVVAITGEGARNRFYAKTVVGAPVLSLLKDSNLEGMRCISGSVLAGESVGKNGFVRFYDSQITVIPEGGRREFLGWLSPGLKKYSFSRTFLSSFLPEREASLDTDTHGSDRTIVLNYIYDDLVPLDILTFFLFKAVNRICKIQKWY